MNIFHTRRQDLTLALYIDGNLQFDSRDEAVYHESLSLPALCLATNPRRVLICGGGDGLALREVLRFPEIEAVTLIDCSQEVVDLAQSEWSELNGDSLRGSRVTLFIEDALTFDLPKDSFDVVICDFTFPTTQESALGFTKEWYSKLRACLATSGVMAVNAVSPQNTPSAFACIVSTIKAAGLSVLPYRVCIPSFRDHGYGAWGFVLAAKKRLTVSQIRRLACPVPTMQADLTKLWRGARFSAKDRIAFSTAPVNRESRPVLPGLLLNPSPLPIAQTIDTPPDFPHLIQQVEISHPYHSRSMIEALAEEVAGSLRSIDLQKLVDELALRAKKLPQKIVQELANLREYLSLTVLDLEVWGLWASRLLATLILVMTIANSISPDPAFAKGGEGLGHASFSRGFSPHDFGVATTNVSRPISGSGFTRTYGSDPVDVYGYHYSPRIYLYGHYGGYGNYGNYRQGSHIPYEPAPHKPMFVLDDDLMAMENGDFLIPLSDTVFLVVAEGQVNLMDSQGTKPLMPVYAEPKLFESIRAEVASQSKDLDQEVSTRRDWLSWVGWTSSLFSTVQADTVEFRNLQDLQSRLGGTMKRLGASPESQSLAPSDDAVELFVGCYVHNDGRVSITMPGGQKALLDGKTIVDPAGESSPLSPQLKQAIVSVLKKMIKETQQDVASDIAERQSLVADQQATQSDLDQYLAIQTQAAYDPTYEVDYGTDSIPVGQAIEKTRQDLNSILFDQAALDTSIAKSKMETERFQSTLQLWGA